MNIGHARMPVFVSYAHEDNKWLDRLLQMLKPLRLNDMVCAWSDRNIELGAHWSEKIRFQLEHYAEAAVLLVSPAYLASDFIRSSELPVLLKRAQEGGVLVVPIILRHCFFAEALFNYPDPVAGPQKLSLSVFQAANPPDRPLDAVRRNEQDQVFARVGRALLDAHTGRWAGGTGPVAHPRKTTQDEGE
jgi:hypothetical protein